MFIVTTLAILFWALPTEATLRRSDLEDQTVYRHNVGLIFQKDKNQVTLYSENFILIVPRIVFMSDPVVMATYDCETTIMVQAFCRSVARIYQRLVDLNKEVVSELRQMEDQILLGFPRNIRFRHMFENNTVITNWIFRRRLMDTVTRHRTKRNTGFVENNELWDAVLAEQHETTAKVLEAYAKSTGQNLNAYENFFNVSVEGNRALYTVLLSRITGERAVSELLFQSVDQSAALTNIYRQYERLRNAVNEAKRGRLSEDLIGTAELSAIFRQINRRLRKDAPGFRIAQTPTEFVSNPKFKITRDNYVLFVELELPVQNFEGASTFALYQIKAFPIAIGTNTSAATIMSDVAPYMLVNLEYWTLLSERPEIDGNLIDMHQLKAPLKTVDNTECILAVFLNEKKQTLENCRFELMAFGVTPNAVRLPERKVLITNTSKYEVNCPNKGSRSVFVDVIQVIVDVPCECSLKSDYFFIPATYKDCAENSSFTDVELFTTVNNLPMLDHWFRNDQRAVMINLNSIMEYALQIFEEDLIPLNKFLQKMAIVGHNIRKARFDLDYVTQVITETHQFNQNITKWATIRYEESKNRPPEQVETEDETSWTDTIWDAVSTVFFVPFTFFSWAKNGFGLSNIFRDGGWLTMILAIVGCLLGLRANCVRGASPNILLPPQARLASTALGFARSVRSVATNGTARATEGIKILNITHYTLNGNKTRLNVDEETVTIILTNSTATMQSIGVNQTGVQTLNEKLLEISVTITIFTLIAALFLLFFVYLMYALLRDKRWQIVIEVASEGRKVMIKMLTLPQSIDIYKFSAIDHYPSFKVTLGLRPVCDIRWRGLLAEHKILKSYTYFPAQIHVSLYQAMQLRVILRQPFWYQLYAIKDNNQQKIKVHIKASAPEGEQDNKKNEKQNQTTTLTFDRTKGVDKPCLEYEQTYV